MYFILFNDHVQDVDVCQYTQAINHLTEWAKAWQLALLIVSVLHTELLQLNA